MIIRLIVQTGKARHEKVSQAARGILYLCNIQQAALPIQ